MAFTIRELESLSGIKAHTIRIWEQRYGFIKPSRTQTNIRTYSNEELKTILTVALLNKYGYKISKIDAMEPEQREQLAMQLPETDAQRELSVNELLGHMVDLESLRFEDVLNRHIRRHGIEYTVTDTLANEPHHPHPGAYRFGDHPAEAGGGRGSPAPHAGQRSPLCALPPRGRAS
jgi:MerR family transcriptional regulator, light-induced transcriptional regulator